MSVPAVPDVALPSASSLPARASRATASAVPESAAPALPDRTPPAPAPAEAGPPGSDTPATAPAAPLLHGTREAWLQAAVERLRPIFAAQGHAVPPVRVSIGWPGSGQRSTVIGECWGSRSSADGVAQIFLVPSLGDPIRVLDVLAHELVHAVDDCRHGHGKEFRRIALSVGLKGPSMRDASAGEALKAKLQAIAAELGEFPHAALKRRAPRPRIVNPPGARCPQCRYRLSIPRRFLHLGPPLCPEHRIEMEPIGDWDGLP